MKANQLEISTRRRKWPTLFGLPVSLCVCVFSGGNFERAVNCFLSRSSLSLSLYRRRIPSGLLFVIHSINVCCLWDFFFLLCGNFVFLFRMYSSIWYYCFDLCIPLLHAVAAALFMFCVCVQVVVSFASPKHECLLLPLRVSACCRCICVNLPKPFCYCESVYWFFCCLFLSQNFLWKTSVVVTYYKI